MGTKRIGRSDRWMDEMNKTNKTNERSQKEMGKTNWNGMKMVVSEKLHIGNCFWLRETFHLIHSFFYYNDNHLQNNSTNYSNK